MTELTFECVIDRELYEFSDKKYINIAVDENTVQRINRIQYISVNINPLVGNILKVKVPFRYRKLEVEVVGDRTVYELKKGDFVSAITVKCCGVWKVAEISGYAWKVTSIAT
jgi:hypothetical protein